MKFQIILTILVTIVTNINFASSNGYKFDWNKPLVVFHSVQDEKFEFPFTENDRIYRTQTRDGYRHFKTFTNQNGVILAYELRCAENITEKAFHKCEADEKYKNFVNQKILKKDFKYVTWERVDHYRIIPKPTKKPKFQGNFTEENKL